MSESEEMELCKKKREEEILKRKNDLSTCIQNVDIFLKISEYLRVCELSVLMRVSKHLQINCQEYFRQRLWGMKQLTQSQFMKKETTDYWKIYRSIFNRDVLFTNISSFAMDRQSVDDLRVFRSRSQRKLFNNIGIKKFSIGTKFTAFLTLEGVLYYCKTTEYFSHDTDDQTLFQKRVGVQKFSTQMRNFMYLTTSGAIYIVFIEQSVRTEELTTKVLEWTLKVPVLAFQASYAFSAFVIKENEADRTRFSAQLSKLVKGQDIQLDTEIQKEDDTSLNILVYHVNDLIPEEVNNPEADTFRMKRIIEYNFNSILSFAVGYHQLLIVAPDTKIYVADLSNYLNIGGVHPNTLPVKEMQNIPNKHFVKVFSGLSSFFAYQREEIPPIDKWTTEQVMEFLASFEEFQDYINIVKYEGIKGSDLSHISKKFMKDRLGLIRDELQLKLMTEIIKYKDATFKQERVYAWGKNEYGQLGLSKCTNVHLPMKVEIPHLEKNDNIDMIKIGWKNSVLVTKERRIFISENRERKAEKRSVENLGDPLEEEEEKRDSKISKKQKKKKQSAADEHQAKIENNVNNNSKQSGKGNKISNASKTSVNPVSVDEQQRARWIEITDKFAELKDRRKYKIIEVSCAKDTICVLGNCYDNKKSTQIQQDTHLRYEDEEDDSKKRLTPVLSILNRIRWDDALNQKEFSIVYQDRFLKDLEISFDTFEESDVKSYRITQIKKCGKVVWDRESKFEDISS